MDLRGSRETTTRTATANPGGGKFHRSGSENGTCSSVRWHYVWTDHEVELRDVLPLPFVWMQGAFGHLASPLQENQKS